VPFDLMIRAAAWQDLRLVDACTGNHERSLRTTVCDSPTVELVSCHTTLIAALAASWAERSRSRLLVKWMRIAARADSASWRAMAA
jgi:hypothetical protein